MFRRFTTLANVAVLTLHGLLTPLPCLSVTALLLMYSPATPAAIMMNQYIPYTTVIQWLLLAHLLSLLLWPPLTIALTYYRRLSRAYFWSTTVMYCSGWFVFVFGMGDRLNWLKDFLADG